MSSDDSTKLRTTSYSTPIGHDPIGKRGNLSQFPAGPRPDFAAKFNNSPGMMQSVHRLDRDMSSMANNFNRMSFPQQAAFGPQSKLPTMPTHMADFPGPSLGGIPHAYWCNGQLVIGSQSYLQAGLNAVGPAPQSPTIFAAQAPHFVSHAGYSQYPRPMVEHSPLSQNWAASRMTSAEMPSLVTPRRDSTSSNEIDAPGTPFTHYTGYGGAKGGFAVIDRSPNSLYSWGTPSSGAGSFGKSQQYNISPHLLELLQQEPRIPMAVPAPYSPHKPLDRCLENSNGTTNVYIRGLHPETTDEMLVDMAKRFGDIAMSKSIIDCHTGLCKGFGFVRYHNFKDAEQCIRGFHYLGYETSFARESFYAQLKKLSNEDNTNLYVSCLPKDINEHQLAALFEPFKVCSSRILRDGSGIGRGVGFARFENRDICEQVIKKFHNTPIGKAGEEDHLIQIRYADSQEQKQLKKHNAIARQYRSEEYKSQTEGGSGFYPDKPLAWQNEVYPPFANINTATNMSANGAADTLFRGNKLAPDPNYPQLNPYGQIVAAWGHATASAAKNGIDYRSASTALDSGDNNRHAIDLSKANIAGIVDGGQAPAIDSESTNHASITAGISNTLTDTSIQAGA